MGCLSYSSPVTYMEQIPDQLPIGSFPILDDEWLVYKALTLTFQHSITARVFAGLDFNPGNDIHLC